MVSRAARIVWARWRDVIERDDIEQEIWVRALENQGALMNLLMDLDEHQQLNLLVLTGSRIAIQYRDDYAVFSGSFVYGSRDVRAMLTCGMLGRTLADIDASTESLVEYIDLHQAVYALSDTHWRTLSKVFLMKEPEPDRKKITRAVDALTWAMNRIGTNREHPDGPGSRPVISNAAARAATP